MKIKLPQLLIIITIGFIAIGISSCKKDDLLPETVYGSVKFSFNHLYNTIPIKQDTTIYPDGVGNLFQVNEIQYFISDIKLYKSDGKKYTISAWREFQYVDLDIPSSLSWNTTDKIPIGSYDSITFTFGFSKEKNKSFMFVNAPEVNMFWPEFLGGGYHYMKFNLKWLDTTGFLRGFPLHLGIGQITDTSGTITGFVHNNFTVNLPQAKFAIKENGITEIPIQMNVENWFKNPHTVNLKTLPSDIMQNQNAMKMFCENGRNVFSVGLIK